MVLFQDLPPEEMMEGSLLTGEGRRKKRKRRSNVERQVPANMDLDEVWWNYVPFSWCTLFCAYVYALL